MGQTLNFLCDEEVNVTFLLFPGRVVRVLGKEKALELLKLTLEKEANGGILTLVSCICGVGHSTWIQLYCIKVHVKDS